MKTLHKQVKYKDFEVDEELLPTIKALNEAGIETLYSCCGLDEDNDKDKPASKRKGETYITIFVDINAELFLRMLRQLIDNIQRKRNNGFSDFIALLEFKLDFYNGYNRCKIYAKDDCTFNNFVFVIEKTLKAYKELQIN